MADSNSLTLTVLGSAGAYRTHDGSRASGYLVQHGATSVVLDLGHGTYAPLAARIGISALPQISAVAISHLHPDHWVDLAALRHALVHGNKMGNDARNVSVISPSGLAARLAALLDDRTPEEQAAGAHEALQPFAFSTWRSDAALPPLGGGRVVSVGDLRMQSARVRHTGESYALRVALRDQPGLTYSGDVSHWEDLAAIARPGDTLLCEAAGGAAEWREGDTHVTAYGAGKAAASAGAAKLLLTHFGAEVDPTEAVRAAATEFAGEIVAVLEGDRFEI
ncbi:MAG: MBL fold metallo-hydrolase [Gammaproteobacteria bacterium]|nr:MBL fold metallo-hydrolase [Gammaproteobacteria bacterium]